MNRLLSMFCLLTCFALSGCFDFAPSKSVIAPTSQYAYAQVFVMRGGLGGLFSKGMNRLQSRLETEYHIKTESTIWYKAYALSEYIKKRYRSSLSKGPIILVGHSLGANDQIKVAEMLNNAYIPVDLLITVDAISPRKIPPNVKHAINIYKPSHVPIFTGFEVVAMNPKVTHIENINVTKLKNFHVNHFNIDKHQFTQDLMVKNIRDVVRQYEKKH